MAELEATFTLENEQNIDATFEIYATGTTWGNISGELENQTDLKNVLDTMSGQITSNHNEITSLSNTIQTYGDIVTYNAADFATSAQGALANTALQPGDNITELANNAGYITAASLPTVNNGKLTIKVNGTQIGTFTANQSGNTTANIEVPDSATWGNITGTLSNQTDLQTALNAKYDSSNPAGYITSSALNGYATESFVTSQGYITSADIPTLEDLTTTAQLSAINSGATTALINQITTNKNAITNETTNRQNADNSLQSQIDAITAASDVTDIVGTYAQLQAYDTSSLPPNSIIKVLQDESRNNETTYYRWVITGGVGSWVLIGEEGPYYTKSESDSIFVPQTRTINGYALSNNISLTASDVGALTSADLVNYVTTNTAQDISGVKTFLGEKAILFKQQAATNKLGFTLYNVSNNELGALEYRPNTINGGALLNVNVPYSSSDYVGFRYWGTAVNVIAPKVSTAGNYYIPVNITDGSNTVTANNTGTLNISSLLSDFVTDSELATTLTDYATQTWVGQQGYLTAITSSDVTNALGYTPYNSTNPNGYTSNVGTVTSVNNAQPDNTGNVAINIPTVNNPTITFTQGGTTKGTITLNQSTDQTIALDAGGGGGGAVIDDNTPSTTTVYSSQKTQDLINALTTRIMALEANINGGNA